MLNRIFTGLGLTLFFLIGFLIDQGLLLRSYLSFSEISPKEFFSNDTNGRYHPGYIYNFMYIITMLSIVYDIIHYRYNDVVESHPHNPYLYRDPIIPKWMEISLGITIYGYALISNDRMFVFYKSQPYRLLYVCFVSQISDTLQLLIGLLFKRYAIGTLFGYPSPKKTIEGYLFTLFLMPQLHNFIIYFYPIVGKVATTEYCLIITLYGMIGGYISSTYKRLIGVKDYSLLLGTHGGFIDRVDGLLSIVPILNIKL